MDSLFDNSGFLSGGILNVTPLEAYGLCKRGAVIVDVREEHLRDFKNFDVPELLFIPVSKLKVESTGLPRDRYLIIADTVGLRSREAALLLKEKEFLKIANLAGGIVDWERDGFPLKTDTGERLSGPCMCQLKPMESKS